MAFLDERRHKVSTASGVGTSSLLHLATWSHASLRVGPLLTTALMMRARTRKVVADPRPRYQAQRRKRRLSPIYKPAQVRDQLRVRSKVQDRARVRRQVQNPVQAQHGN